MHYRKFSETPAAQLEQEFAQERASALGRLGRALEAALAALAEFDAGHPREVVSTEAERALRAKIVAEAGMALWHFAVQREVCGLRDIRHVLRDYGVPPEVSACMGVMPTSAARPRR